MLGMECTFRNQTVIVTVSGKRRYPWTVAAECTLRNQTVSAL